MSGMHGGMGMVYRNLRSDRSVVGQRLTRDTVRRVLGFAGPHRRHGLVRTSRPRRAAAAHLRRRMDAAR